MPIYVFKCETCSLTFEELVLSRESAGRLACPHCRGARLTKIQAPFATTSGESDGDTCCGNGACPACDVDD